MNKKLKIVFMGTPEFARVILEKVWSDEEFEVVAVFAQPDKPVGRGKKLSSPPVAVFAKEKGLPLFQPARLRNSEELNQITDLQPDYIIVAAYGKILPTEVLSAAKKECLNVHASLLPKYRGAAPINYAILNDDKKTGISIMRVVKELDAGAVFLDKEIPIEEDDTAITLTEKLARIGGDAIIETIQKIESGNLQPKEQNPQKVTYSPKLTKEMAELIWSLSAREIFNRVRGLVPWPVVKTKLNGKAIKIYNTKCLNENSKEEPGVIVHIGKAGWTVATGDKNILIEEVQLEGKKRMKAYDLANGMRLEAGTKLG